MVDKSNFQQEEIESLRQQLTAALAKCKDKDFHLTQLDKQLVNALAEKIHK